MASSAALGARLRSWADKRWVARIGAALFVVSIPVALVGSNVRYLFGEQRLYTFAINRYDVPAVTGIPKPELMRATGELRDYLFGSDELVRIQVTDSQGFTGPLFNPREVGHMRDVRVLVQRIFRLQEAALVIALGYPLLSIVLHRRAGARSVMNLTWLTGLAVNLGAIAFGVGAALGFDSLFTRFHTLSFSNDLWQLDPRRDHLIQMFPFEFWQISAGLLVAMTVVEAALLAAASRWYLAVSDRPPAASNQQPESKFETTLDATTEQKPDSAEATART
ncbi:MAG: TIGR01906 family membrane protein [Chloroflexi bacterium]|nr:TIGR01906 family membrane protein [Chloroflexota bacterium]